MKLLRLGLLCVSALVLAAGGSAAGGRATWVADGFWGIQALVASGQTAFVGGDFSRLAPETGSFVVYRQGVVGPPVPTASPDGNGAVAAAVADGAGGWFVGGEFSTFGGVRCPNLVHVRADGSVDRAWCPRTGSVSGLAREGRALYAIAPVADDRGSSSAVVRLDARTARRSVRWRLRLGTDFAIYPPNVWVVAASPRLVVLGGGFASVDGGTGRRIAAVDATTGRRVWGGSVRDGAVRRLVIADGRVYALGGFDWVDGRPRDGLAVFDLATGRLLDSPAALRGGRAIGMAASPSTLFIGYVRRPKKFTRQAPDALVAVSRRTGRVLWRRLVDAVPLAATERAVYVSAARSVAALDAATGAPSGWRISPEELSGVAVAPSGARVAVGGAFASVGPGATRRGLAAVDISSGAVRPARADIDLNAPYPDVGVLASAGARVYAAGSFSTVGGQPRAGLAALDGSSGRLLPWRAQGRADCYTDWCSMAATPAAVYLAWSDFLDSRLVVGKKAFPALAFDAATGAPLPWHPKPDDSVDALAIGETSAYLGGAFSRVNGAARPYLAGVDLGLGATTSWRPQPDDEVDALALSGTTLYVGGRFTHMGRVVRRGLAAFDTTTGALLPWDPGAEGLFDRVTELAVVGQTVYVLDSDSRKIVAVDGVSGAPRSWPDAPTDVAVFAADSAGVIAAESPHFAARLLVVASAPR